MRRSPRLIGVVAAVALFLAGLSLAVPGAHSSTIASEQTTFHDDAPGIDRVHSGRAVPKHLLLALPSTHAGIGAEPTHAVRSEASPQPRAVTLAVTRGRAPPA